MKVQTRRAALSAVALAFLRAALLVKRRFDAHMRRPRTHAAQGSVLLVRRQPCHGSVDAGVLALRR